MKLHAIIAAIILTLIVVANVQAQSTFRHKDSDSQSTPADHHHQRFEYLSTAAILEPNGYTAACFATNLDDVNHLITADIFDWTGANVTETSSCGVLQGPGITCQSTAQYRNNAALRCVVATSGRAKNLRGSLSTSAGPYPFASPANSTIAAQ